jgi:hypothetical protein
VRVGAVDLDLLEEREIGLETILDEAFNFLIGACFLVVDIVGGEGQNLKAFAAEFVIQLREPLVVGRGHCSLGSNVNDQDGFFPFVNRKINNLSIDVLSLEIEEGLGPFLFEEVFALLIEAELCQCSHLCYQKN